MSAASILIGGEFVAGVRITTRNTVSHWADHLYI